MAAAGRRQERDNPQGTRKIIASSVGFERFFHTPARERGKKKGTERKRERERKYGKEARRRGKESREYRGIMWPS